ncbi:hypothetical protein VTO42DRAFT_8469 [Malbranchea cinnamomea]
MQQADIKSKNAKVALGDRAPPGRQPRKLIFAPGDIAAPPTSSPAATKVASAIAPRSHLPSLDDDLSTQSGASTPSANAAIVANAARAHQFGSNPPLTYSQIDPVSPLHQFHAWFRDPRLLPSSAPETCTLATASMPSGRVSARIVYLKELDERGWVVYSNWGSRAGKGGQVFGTTDTAGAVDADSTVGGVIPDDSQGQLEGNRWAALTFHWPTVERQVRIEGLVEPLSKEESETYWRVRERGSQIGAWASQQSKVLWSTEPKGLADKANDSADNPELQDDGRSVLENRVKEMEKRFEGVEEIPLPPFWGGVRIVPESVEFWQGRKSRLHDRFRYVRVHDAKEGAEEIFRWRIQRLSP